MDMYLAILIEAILMHVEILTQIQIIKQLTINYEDNHNEPL